MNVFTFYSYAWRYYLIHPWAFFKHCFRNFKMAWQRATKGYCDYDVGDFNMFFLKIVPAIIQEQLDSDYFGIPAGKSETEWREKLNEIIRLFTFAREGRENEYEFDYENEIRRLSFNDNSMPRNKELIDKYFKKEQEIGKEKATALNKGMDLFKEAFWGLWV